MTDSPNSLQSQELDPEYQFFFVYTQAAEQLAYSHGMTVSEAVTFAIDKVEQSWREENFRVWPTLAGIKLVDYVESDFHTDLNMLTGTHDGFMDEVHLLRDSMYADLVVLLRSEDQSQQIAGIAWVATSPNDTLGFSVVNIFQAASYHTLPHELGHNLGMRHDRFQQGTVGSSVGYNYGASDPDAKLRTIMAYSKYCTSLGLTCPAVSRYSKPPPVVPKGSPPKLGTAIGEINAAYNVEMLCRNSGPVSQYR